MTGRPFINGAIAVLILLGIYFGLISAISGWTFAKSQFSTFWYFILGLAFGFGIQVGLYTYLRTAVRNRNASGEVLAVSGTTSTAAMVSCCSHYLANILPILGIAGFVSLVAQYQVELFWAGLLFNAGGILYLGNKIIRLNKT